MSSQTERAMSWKPTASISTLKRRAKIIDAIRQFFKSRDVLEVETPLLSHASVPDPNIPSFHLSRTPSSKDLYLQTSPEFAMKRLLAAGSGSIFQINKAFRQGEISKTHNPEFTMLEWYRVGFDHHQLMDEMEELLQLILKTNTPATRLTYQAVFEQHLNINPHEATVNDLKNHAEKNGVSTHSSLTKDEWLDVLFTHLIQHKLDDLTFIYHYPTSQAALARIHQGVAERFEVFAGGYELANGFHELSNAHEQRSRFEADLVKRKQQNADAPVIDEHLLSALEHGLPDCAGVALGVDRLIMLTLEFNDIRDVISFDFNNA